MKQKSIEDLIAPHYYPIVPYSKVPFVIPSAEELEFLEETHDLEVKLADLKEEVERLEALIGQFTGLLETDPEIRELSIELNKLKLKAKELEAPPIIPDDIKKLFKKIAKDTHPDKVSNPELNNLFVEAEEAKNIGDYESLEIILAALKGIKKNKQNKVEKHLKLLEKRKADLLERKEDLLNSDIFKLIVIYSKGDTKNPFKYYKGSLKNSINSLKAKLQEKSNETFSINT